MDFSFARLQVVLNRDCISERGDGQYVLDEGRFCAPCGRAVLLSFSAILALLVW